MLDVAVAVQHDTMPAAQIGGHRGQPAQQRLLEREQRQRPLARGAVQALPGLVHHPGARLGVQIGEVTEAARGQEVGLEVFDPRFDDPFFLRVSRRACVNLERVPLGALGVGALDQRIVDAGLDDGALGVVDDDALDHAVEPLEGAAVAAQPGGHALIPDELHVLVAAVAQRHHEGPGTPGAAVGMDEHGAGAEVDLGGLARRKAQPHGELGGLFGAQLVEHAHHGRVAATEGVLALQRGVDGTTLHAGFEPATNHLAMRLDAGDGGLRARGLRPSAAKMAASSGSSSVASSQPRCPARAQKLFSLSRPMRPARAISRTESPPRSRTST